MTRPFAWTPETPMLDPDEAMLRQLAAHDLAAAERAHERLVAAEAPAELAELGLTYERLAGSLRRTLALKARLTRDREAAEREAIAFALPRTAAKAVRTGQRQRQVYEAIDAVIWAEHQAQRLDRPDAILALLLEHLAAEAADDRFADEDPTALVARICADLGLPAPAEGA